MKKKFKWKWYYTLLSLVVVIVIIAIINGNKEPLTEVTTAKVMKRSIIETVAANGKVQPEVEVKITPEVAGEIIDVYVKEGDSVKQGQLIMRINPDLLASDKDRNLANLNNARANYENAKSRLAQQESRLKSEIEPNYQRNKKLHKDRVISESEWQTINAAYEVAVQEVAALKSSVNGAQYSINAAEATLKQSQKNLNRTELFASMDGIISKMNVKKGEKVAQTGTMAGTDLYKIADLSSIQLIVEVSENDILKVSMHDSAIVEIDAYPGRKFKGVVYEIANSPISTTTAVTTDQVTNFEVKIRILKSSYAELLAKGNQPFRPGMSGSAEIQTESETNVLSLPLEAITLRDDTAKNKSTESSYDNRSEVVFVLENGEAKMKKVKTGIQDNSFIKVEGLKENQEIITGPYSAVSRSLNDGDKVKKSEMGAHSFKPKDKKD